ncbi:MAG: CRISPR-associated protein Cas4 [Thermoplasmata archaeon]|nr:CRISPR-associated protein Cas4 [Thermoplasmata archaeon]
MTLLAEALFTGTQVNYYIVCPTKLWLFSHHIGMETESEHVQVGKHIHETSYAREKKEIIIDDRIGIDFMRQGEKIVICEVKKSKKLERAHLYQLWYYLYYLHKVKGMPDVEGQLLYPATKEREVIQLTSEVIAEIEQTLSKIKEIISQPKAPEPVYKPYCKSCAYYEFCWV